MGHVLIIDDDTATCEILQLMVEKIGHQAESCHTLQEGLETAQRGSFDVIFLDVLLPDGSGLEHIEEMQDRPDAPEVIIITGDGSTDGAEVAIRSGAWDYLQKPLSPKRILLPIKRVMEYRENTRKNRPMLKLLKRDRIIGSSKPVQMALERLAQAAATETGVLLQGETGTGKEVFARTLHENSARAGGPMVVVDCAALPENLIESVLFGYVKGAFTGADKNVDGLVKMADGGTLFLDEIGELSLVLQKTLLRVLQEKRFRPIGARRELQSDFRCVAATNRNLQEMVLKGTFRKDLFFRVGSNVIVIPPLRDRLDDIENLLTHYIRAITESYAAGAKGVSPDFLEALKAYPWPGNIRELISTVEQAVIKSQGSPILYLKHLPHSLRIEVIGSRLKDKEDSPAADGLADPSAKLGWGGALPILREYREEALEKIEKNYLKRLMLETEGEIKHALEIAGIGRTHLYNLLKKYNITRQ